MKTELKQNLAMYVKELTGWATPREGLSLDELKERIEARGEKVLEIDYANNRLRVIQYTNPLPPPAFIEAFQCEKCLNWGLDKAQVESHELNCKGVN